MISCSNCPVCDGSTRIHFLSHNDTDLWSCGSCGLIYMDPMPGPSDLEELYGDDEEATFTVYFKKVDRKLQRSARRVREIRRRLGSVNGHAPRLLDVGCSGGFLVEAARRQGFEAVGVDPDPVTVDYAREHYPDSTFICGTIDDVPADVVGDGFDAIYSSEVIEHIPDARGFVKSLAKALRPGGILYITTPDISHWRRPRDVTKWDGYNPPWHCIYFSPTNLSRLLIGAGFNIIRRKWSLKPGIKILARRST